MLKSKINKKNNFNNYSLSLRKISLILLALLMLTFTAQLTSVQPVDVVTKDMEFISMQGKSDS